MRDVQRQRVYDAEEQVCRQLEYAAAGARTLSVAGSTVTLPLEVRFGSLTAVQRYVDAVRSSEAFAALFPQAAGAPLRVRARRGGRHAHYEPPGTIALHEPEHGTAWALRELVVLHEIVHHGQRHDLPGGAAHGPAFAGALAHLAGRIIGPEVGLLLSIAYAEHGVRTSAPTMVGRA
jgi:putative metallohydrolase (TIGR04338 family)